MQVLKIGSHVGFEIQHSANEPSELVEITVEQIKSVHIKNDGSCSIIVTDTYGMDFHLGSKDPSTRITN